MYNLSGLQTIPFLKLYKGKTTCIVSCDNTKMIFDRRIFLFILLFTGLTQLSAQIPTKCFEIQSILVDACGNPEGENEMVRFIIGPSDMNTANLTVNWPNNPYLGICQNGTTASHVAALNATIRACGLILEPVGGVLPAGATVLLVTSTSMNPTYNSFAGLTDTLYMIFQCSGNTAGHFRNFSTTTAVRSLSMSFTGFCSDQVSYDAAELVDQNGNRTTADGSTVDYDFAGYETYTNPGCQAPIAGIQVHLSASNTVPCSGDPVSLSAVILSGNYLSYFWAGGTGTYTNPTQLNTFYQTNSSFQGSEFLQFGVVGICNDTLFQTIQITSVSGITATVNSSGPTTFCVGDSVILTASPGNSYSWSTSDTTQSITVFTSNTYTVNVIGNCGTATASQTVIVNTLPVANITASGPTQFCQGSSVTLTAAGTGPYLWSTGETSSSISVSTSGTYILSVLNSCGTDTTSEEVIVKQLPTATISGAPAVVCPGEIVTLTASGGTSYLWSNGETTESIKISNGGNYNVTASNDCGSAQDNVVIASSNLNVSFTADTLSGSYPLDINFSNTTFGGDTYNWNFDDGSSSTTNSPHHTFQYNGTFNVLLTGTDALGCSGTAQISIVVYDDSKITIPNAFTPNGDGKNEFFNVITNKSSLVVSGQIFNRWGGEIATWNSLEGGWNGITSKGSTAAGGIYVYIIKITYPDGDIQEHHGAVSLIR